MNQKLASTQIMSSKQKLLRQAALLGAPLLLLLDLIWPGLTILQTSLSAFALVLLLVALLTFIDRSVGLWHPRNLAILLAVVIFVGGIAAHFVWRAGRIVAVARFDPGIAPFDVTVREVPVPVTHSHHFIVTLKRGQYPVTSFRYFWIAYTPKTVRLEWTHFESFKVIFDERYIATCEWSWGKQAQWTMLVPPGAQEPGDQP